MESKEKRICKKCGISKEDDEYYSYPGHTTNICKTCTIERVVENQKSGNVILTVVLPFSVNKAIKVLGREKIVNICQVAIELEYRNTRRDNEIKSNIAFLDKQNGF